MWLATFMIFKSNSKLRKDVISKSVAQLQDSSNYHTKKTKLLMHISKENVLLFNSYLNAGKKLLLFHIIRPIKYFFYGQFM